METQSPACMDHWQIDVPDTEKYINGWTRWTEKTAQED